MTKRYLEWFGNGDERICPLLSSSGNNRDIEQINQNCNGDCIFWCKVVSEEKEEASDFDCMLRLAVLKYLGLDYRGGQK